MGSSKWQCNRMWRRVQGRMRTELMHMVEWWKKFACVMHVNAGERAVTPAWKTCAGGLHKKTAYTEREGKRMYMQAITGEMERGGMEDEVEED